MASEYGPETTTKIGATLPEKCRNGFDYGQWVAKPPNQRGSATWKRFWRGITEWKNPWNGEHNKKWRTETARGERDARGRNTIGSSGSLSDSGDYGNTRTAWCGGHKPTRGGATTTYCGGNVPACDNGTTAWFNGRRPAYDGTTAAYCGGNVPAYEDGPTAWFGGHKPA